MKNRLVGIIACLVFFVGTSMSQSAPKPYGALPSARQLAWHEMEMYGLIHFTPTTFEIKSGGMVMLVLQSLIQLNLMQTKLCLH